MPRQRKAPPLGLSLGGDRRQVAQDREEKARRERAETLVSSLRSSLPQLHECPSCTVAVPPSSSHGAAASGSLSSISSSSAAASSSSASFLVPSARPATVSTLPHLHPASRLPPRQRPRTTIYREVRLRELGLWDSLRPGQIMPSLLLSDTREFVQESEVHFPGRIDFSDHRVLTTEGAYNIESGYGASFLRSADPLGGSSDVDTSKIIDMIAIYNDTQLPDGSISPNLVVCLNDRGQVLIFSASDDPMPLQHRFFLPAHLYKFKRLEWNTSNCSFFVYGESLREHIDDTPDEEYVRGAPGGGRRVPEASLALFCVEVSPHIRVRCLMKLEHKFFHNAHYALLFEDILLIFGRPNCIVLYDFMEIYNEFCTSVCRPEDYGSLSAQPRVVEFNVHVTRAPQPSAYIPATTRNNGGGNSNRSRVQNSYLSIDMAGQPLYLLLEPEQTREPFSLIRADTLRGQPLFPQGFHLLGRQEGCQLGIEIATTFFHPDKSSRLLRFEGTSLACYALIAAVNGCGVKANGEPHSSLSLEWRTPLMLPGRTVVEEDSVREWRNRLCKTSLQPPALAEFVVVMEVSYHIEGVLAVIMLYQSSVVDNPTTIAYYDNEEWVPIVFLLDSFCGRILKICLTDIETEYPTQRCRTEPRFYMFNEMMMFVSRTERQPNVRRVKIQRLMDARQLEWKSEIRRQRTRYVAAVQSRKEARKRRKEHQQRRGGEAEEREGRDER